MSGFWLILLLALFGWFLFNNDHVCFTKKGSSCNIHYGSNTHNKNNKDDNSTTISLGHITLPKKLSADSIINGTCTFHGAQGPFNVTVNGTIQQNSHSLTCNELTVNGSAKNVSDITVKGLNIRGSFTANNVRVENNTTVLGSCNLQHAHLNTMIISGHCTLEDSEATTITIQNNEFTSFTVFNQPRKNEIVLSGNSTNVDTIIFKDEAGFVVLKKGALVTTIINGSIIQE